MDLNKYGINLIIQKDRDETDNLYAERVWWILSQMKGNCDPNMEKLIALSYVYINEKKGCEYSIKLNNNNINK
jgi:hypothetical protein